MNLAEKFAAIRAEAESLAGGILEIPRRVVLLLQMYRDSAGNHTFPLMAAHGALWASGYFESGGSLGRLIAKRYFYNPKERIYRLGILQKFAEDFRRVNRQVCIDSWANYHFTAAFGDEPAAAGFVPEPLLSALNRVHRAKRSGAELSDEDRKDVFTHSFHCEQEVTVAPGVEAAIRAFECRIMQFICLHPIVRFSYFPTCRYLVFRNFSSKEERIRKGMKAWDLASQAGWANVENSLGLYGAMPLEHLADPAGELAELRKRVLRDARAISAGPTETDLSAASPLHQPG